MHLRPLRLADIPAGIPAGTLATLTMDVAMVAAAELGGPAFNSDRVGPDMIGRWAANLARDNWRDTRLVRARRLRRLFGQHCA